MAKFSASIPEADKEKEDDDDDLRQLLELDEEDSSVEFVENESPNIVKPQSAEDLEAIGKKLLGGQPITS
jgi:hypothetical protein